mgnify:CR=1 FL=1
MRTGAVFADHVVELGIGGVLAQVAHHEPELSRVERTAAALVVQAPGLAVLVLLLFRETVRLLVMVGYERSTDREIDRMVVRYAYVWVGFFDEWRVEELYVYECECWECRERRDGPWFDGLRRELGCLMGARASGVCVGGRASN